MGASENAALIRRNWELFADGQGEAVYATWAEDAVWHVLDATRFQGDYTRDEYFTMLATTWAEYVTSYAPQLVSCESFGDELVVADARVACGGIGRDDARIVAAAPDDERTVRVIG